MVERQSLLWGSSAFRWNGFKFVEIYNNYSIRAPIDLGQYQAGDMGAVEVFGC